MIDTRLAYQPLLRAVGAMLDERSPKKVRVVELPGGFEVHWHCGGPERGSESTFCSIDEATKLAEKVRRKKVRFSFGGSKVSEDRSYQNIFRALGYELDTVGAYSVLIDELEDKFLITYQYLKASESYMIRKRMAVLGESETLEVLNSAQMRRSGSKQVMRGLFSN